MIYSMTGFAAVAAELETGSLALELRAVNHRYLDLQIKTPDEFRLMEGVLRETLAAQLTRGKVECRISFAPRSNQLTPTQINLPLLQQLVQWNSKVQAALPDARSLSVAEVLQWRGMLESHALPSDTLRETLLQLAQQALAEFAAARAREGDKLKDFLLQRVEQIEQLRRDVAPRIPAAIKAYEEKIGARLREALGGNDDERMRQELALFASKIDVDEELSRLQTHLTEMRRVLDKGGNVGKRLDFLMQELHREANTLGAKSVDADVSRSSMEMKILIEQMREQIQNLE